MPRADEIQTTITINVATRDVARVQVVKSLR
jgi:hypothetical protein